MSSRVPITPLLTKVNLFAWNDFTIAFRFGVGILSL